eukprot:scaffold128502_cov17-Tisochrysis_lutea.AAC.2
MYKALLDTKGQRQQVLKVLEISRIEGKVGLQSRHLTASLTPRLQVWSFFHTLQERMVFSASFTTSHANCTQLSSPPQRTLPHTAHLCTRRTPNAYLNGNP